MKTKLICTYCNEEYYSFYLNKSKYCSPLCKNKMLYRKHRDKRLQQKREYHQRPEVKEYRKFYEKHLRPNKELRAQQKLEYEKNRYHCDEMYKFKFQIRRRINHFLKAQAWKEKSEILKIVGCTPKQLRKRFERLLPRDMKLSDYGKWEIDHKIPLAMANTKREVIELCHYTNLQPLCAIENSKKGDKINGLGN